MNPRVVRLLHRTRRFAKRYGADSVLIGAHRFSNRGPIARLTKVLLKVRRVALFMRQSTSNPGALTVEFSRRPSQSATRRDLAVIVPIYNGSVFLESSLRTLQQRTPSWVTLILIDDGSSDRDVHRILQAYEPLENVQVVYGSSNLGYTARVNEGIEMAGEKDVILLNSDTTVTAGWIHGLVRAAYSDSRIAAVSPLFDDDSQFSVGTLADSADVEAFARSLRRRTPSRSIYDAPTAHGACVYLKRSALAEVGLMDMDNFPRGYGEENDWSQRAIAAGWRVVIDTRTFVSHRGTQSFSSPERESLIHTAMEAMARLHPTYRDQVVRFIRPSSRFKRAVRVARRRAKAPFPKAILHVAHEGFGGTFTFIRQMARILPGYRHLVVTANASNLYVWWKHGGRRYLLDHTAFARAQRLGNPHSDAYERKISSILELEAPDLVFVHNLIHHDWRILDWCASRGIPVNYHLHDFYALCPSHNLLDENRRFCAGACTATAGSCNPHIPISDLRPITPELKNAFVRPWSHRTGQYLQSVDQISAPSQFARDVLLGRFPSLEPLVVPVAYGTEIAKRDYQVPGLGAGERPRVLVLGNIDRAKGFDTLLETVSSPGGKDFAFYHAGALAQPVLTSQLTQFGPYTSQDLPLILDWARPHIALVLSDWGETHSYVLSELLCLSVPVVTSPRGALKERWPFHIDDTSPETILESLRQTLGDFALYEEIQRAARAWVPVDDEELAESLRSVVEIGLNRQIIGIASESETRE